MSWVLKNDLEFIWAKGRSIQIEEIARVKALGQEEGWFIFIRNCLEDSECPGGWER